jgi:hypothetical protein
VKLYDPAGELSGTRIAGILSLLGMGAGQIDAGVSRVIAAGLSSETLQLQLDTRTPLPEEDFPPGTVMSALLAVDLTGSIIGDPSSSSVLELIQLVETSEGGLFFVMADGSFRFVDRHSGLNAPSLATFGDAPDELPYTGLALGESDTLIRNDVTVQRVGGNPQTATDAASIDEFGEQSFNVTGLLLTNDLEVSARAQFLAAKYGQPTSRVDRVDLVPAVDPDRLWPHALGREIAEAVTLRRRPQGIGAPIELVSRIEGVQHRWSPRQWDVSWSLSPSDAFTADGQRISWLQLDSGTPLGSSRLAW